MISELGEPSLATEIRAVESLCRHALETEYADLAAQVPGLPQEPRRWIEIMSGIPDEPRCCQELEQLCQGAPAGAVERFGMLQAALAALPQLESLKIHDSLNRQFCATFRRVATRPEGWSKYFQYKSDAYSELARIVSLRRYHTGQISFDIMDLPRTWFLKVHPLALLGLVRAVIREMGSLGPIMMPHLNYWRGNTMTLSKRENEVSHYRMVQFMEQQPQIKGLVSASWLYSSDMERFSPHIAWLRDFYIDNGAYLVDMEVAHLRSGFLVGSEERRRLHAEGKIRPRETLVIWSRERMIAWARRYERAQDIGRKADPPTTRTARPEPKWQSKANEILSSGQYTLINWGLLLRDRPRRYVTLVFGLPLAALAVAVAATLSVWTVLPALIFGFIAIWLLQYFFLQ